MSTTAEALSDCFLSQNVPDSNMEAANVVDVIAGAGLNISRAMDRLGTNRANTGMGAIELLAKEVAGVAGALNRIAAALEARK